MTTKEMLVKAIRFYLANIAAGVVVDPYLMDAVCVGLEALSKHEDMLRSMAKEEAVAKEKLTVS